MIEPDSINNIVAGSAGSGIAAWLARATGYTLIFMFMGGLSAAWFLGPVVAKKVDLVENQAAVGFAVGFLSIMLMRKVFEVIESFPAAKMGRSLLSALRNLLGVKDDE